MKKEELRIGIILYDCLRNKNVTLNIKHFKELDIDEKCFFDRYWPIELKEAWLLKLGFKYNTYGAFSVDFKQSEDTFRLFPFTSGGEFNGMWGVSGMPQLQKKIWYVHQLQNLMYALGEELTLKEEK